MMTSSLNHVQRKRPAVKWLMMAVACLVLSASLILCMCAPSFAQTESGNIDNASAYQSFQIRDVVERDAKNTRLIPTSDLNVAKTEKIAGGEKILFDASDVESIDILPEPHITRHLVVCLGTFVNRPIINEIENAPAEGVDWHDNHSGEARKQPEKVIKNLASQTGLTFAEEVRPVRVLFFDYTNSGTP